MMRKQALVVHPDHSVRIVLERWARAEGYHSQSVPGGDEAIRAARFSRIDLIVLDRTAPPSESFDLILRLMTDPHLSRIPIAFANSGKDDLPLLVTSRAVH
jgi:CheY-like chemotaxis protein